MEEQTGKYMVEFEIQHYYKTQIEEILEDQKQAIANYIYEGMVFSFSIANDFSHIWMIFLADSESEMINFIENMPITKYCDYNYKELYIHHTVQFIPENSMN